MGWIFCLSCLILLPVIVPEAGASLDPGASFDAGASFDSGKKKQFLSIFNKILLISVLEKNPFLILNMKCVNLFL